MSDKHNLEEHLSSISWRIGHIEKILEKRHYIKDHEEEIFELMDALDKIRHHFPDFKEAYFLQSTWKIIEFYTTNKAIVEQHRSDHKMLAHILNKAISIGKADLMPHEFVDYLLREWKPV